MSKKKILVSVGLMLILTLSFYFLTDMNSVLAEESDELIIAQPDDAAELDPLYWGASHSYSVIDNMFETILKFDDEGEIQPNLAEDWEQIEEGRWRFYLKEGIEFHNGEPFNADAVKFTIESIIDPADPAEPAAPQDMLIPETKGAEVVDDYTVDILTEEGFGMLPAYLAHDIFVVPPEHYQDKGYDEFRDDPVGTGPYEFVSWDIDEEIVLEKNEDYWREEPEFDEVVYKVIPEDGTRLSELRAGGIDIMSDLPPPLIEEVEGEVGVKVESVPSYRLMFFKLDYNQSPTDDKKVRKAINYAVDQNAMAEDLFMDLAEPISQAVPEDFTGYNPDLDPYPYDPDRAKELLDEAGYDGEEIVIEGPSDTFLIPEDILENVAAYLRGVGINARVESHAWGTSLDRLLTREQGHLYYNGYANANYDSETILTRIIHSETDWSLINNPDLDEVIEELRVTPEPEKRQELGAEAMKIMNEDAAWLFMYQQPVLAAVADDIEFTPSRFESYSAMDATRID